MGTRKDEQQTVVLNELWIYGGAFISMASLMIRELGTDVTQGVSFIGTDATASLMRPRFYWRCDGRSERRTLPHGNKGLLKLWGLGWELFALQWPETGG